LLDSLYGSYQSWHTLVDGVLQDTGSSIKTFRGDVAGALVGRGGEGIDNVKAILEEAGGDFKALKEAIDDAAGRDDKSGIKGSVSSLRDSIYGSVYGDGKKGIIGASTDTRNSIDTLSENASEDFVTLAESVESW
jgi:hypothetical protein